LLSEIAPTQNNRVVLYHDADAQNIFDSEINQADHVKQNRLYTKQTRVTRGTSFSDKDEIIVGC